jgi:DNA-binding Lrp family transcriptional regulator
MSKVSTQQQQIDELRARLERLEDAAKWVSIPLASQQLGISPTTIRRRIAEKPFKGTFRRYGRNYQIHLEKFERKLDVSAKK